VVVVSHNHAATLPACLAAVGRLDPAPHTVVLVDNASTDGSARVAADHVASLPLEMRVAGSNTGFAAAANTAVSATSTPWVLVLNPDCAPRPDFAARLLDAVDRRPERDEVGSATGKLRRAGDDELNPADLVDAAGMIVDPSGRHFDRGAGEPDDGRWDAPAWVFGGTGAATLYRRAALGDVAYPGEEFFAESFFAYREDAELAWRLQWRGWRCLYVPSAQASHRRGLRPEQGRRGHAAINRHSVRNRFLMRIHCADLGWHLGCLPWWLLRDVLVVGACLTVEKSSLPALAQVWRLRRDAAARRRHVLGQRTTPSRRTRRWFRRRGWVEEIVED
jgi:GT2 family glycosyltransferase